LKSQPRLERELREEIARLEALVIRLSESNDELQKKLKESRGHTFAVARGITDRDLSVGTITYAFD
jgi:hypothetical protein